MPTRPRSCCTWANRSTWAALPPLPKPLVYADHAVVDGGGFDGKSPSHSVPELYDPRAHAAAARGKDIYDSTLAEVQDELKPMLDKLKKP